MLATPGGPAIGASGAVIALCLQARGRPEGAPDFAERTIDGFDFVVWSDEAADYVIVGPPGRGDLTAIARAAAIEV